MKQNTFSTFLVLSATLILSGCGGAPAPKLEEGMYRGVYVSTNDCADDTNLSFEICSEAVNNAIEAHTNSSPTYASLRACVATEGPDKCERDMNEKYRPRLLAYLIETSNESPPKGIPLYAAADGAQGFKDAANTMYLESDLTLAFSKRAIAAFVQYMKPNQKRASPF